VPFQFAPHPACSVAIELDSDVETRPQHDLRGQRAPGLAVERDLDAFP
jgi:hypothetical protein